jgi:hypothetical protein
MGHGDFLYLELSGASIDSRIAFSKGVVERVGTNEASRVTRVSDRQRSSALTVHAIRYGLTAETVIAGLEDPDSRAESAVERELVLRLASVLWRLRRATGIESGLFESVEDSHRREQHGLSRENLRGVADLAERWRLFLARQTNPPALRKMTSAPIQKPISRTAFCAWQICRLSPFIVSAVANTCCGGKRDKFVYVGVVSRRRQPCRSTFPFSFRRREPDAMSEQSG